MRNVLSYEEFQEKRLKNQIRLDFQKIGSDRLRNFMYKHKTTNVPEDIIVGIKNEVIAELKVKYNVDIPFIEPKKLVK